MPVAAALLAHEPAQRPCLRQGLGHQGGRLLQPSCVIVDRGPIRPVRTARRRVEFGNPDRQVIQAKRRVILGPGFRHVQPETPAPLVAGLHIVSHREARIAVHVHAQHIGPPRNAFPRIQQRVVQIGPRRAFRRLPGPGAQSAGVERRHRNAGQPRAGQRLGGTAQ